MNSLWWKTSFVVTHISLNTHPLSWVGERHHKHIRWEKRQSAISLWSKINKHVTASWDRVEVILLAEQFLWKYHVISDFLGTSRLTFWNKMKLFPLLLFCCVTSTGKITSTPSLTLANRQTCLFFLQLVTSIYSRIHTSTDVCRKDKDKSSLQLTQLLHLSKNHN